MKQRWPDPLIQPDKTKDCLVYSVAYLCHCLGYPATTVDQIRQYRRDTRWTKSSFPEKRLALSADPYWRHTEPAEYQRFWLGPSHRLWVEQHLLLGHIALACVHRIPTLGHMVVLLEASSSHSQVLLADPIFGLREETWEWFLGSGPGTHTGHRIESWYWS